TLIYSGRVKNGNFKGLVKQQLEDYKMRTNGLVFSSRKVYNEINPVAKLWNWIWDLIPISNIPLKRGCFSLGALI
ncbi:hypothetical protein ABDI30_22510, partial [Paenibacillus cisolokensis]|uniref:hypothetical protein n=1 Tax=Paenibacillus cisolokensis TaxID=1658519 RepID=UPI003D27A5A7